MGKREERYRQKISFIAEKIGSISKKIDSPLAVDATLYRIQVAIDAAMDLVAMTVKDKGMEVSDDYSMCTNTIYLRKTRLLKTLAK